jgi:hypothetical protein
MWPRRTSSGILRIEQRQEERADVRAVHVRVGHHDDLVVAQLVLVELLGQEARADRAHDRLDLVVVEDRVDRRLLDVQDLALERQDRLERHARLLGGPAGRVTLDDVELGVLGCRALVAVGELRGQAAALEPALAHELASLARGLAGAQLVHDLDEDPLGGGRVLLAERPQAVPDDRLDDRLRLAVAELDLGLALELRVRDLHREHGRKARAEVLSGRHRSFCFSRSLAFA